MDCRKFVAGTAASISGMVLPSLLGAQWQNGYCESFNGKFREQFLNGELFYSLSEARILIEQWRIHYNTVRPHRSMGRRAPAPASGASDSTTHHTLHQSLFSPIPTP